MERIGLAASKIAKGNLLWYNFYVILLSLLFSFLVFFISGSSIVIVLIIVAYLSHLGSPPDLTKGWMPVMVMCMYCLAVVIGFFTLLAIIKNIKLRRAK